MAFLLDSNILIYSYSDEFKYLRSLIVDSECIISEISRVEVLGYHALRQDEKEYFEAIFDYVSIILPDQEIFERAIEIRQRYNLKLADSIIAATAVINSLEIYNRNLSDFERIAGLKSTNPIQL